MSIDQFVLLTIVAGTSVAAWRFRRTGARGRTLFAATWLAFFGLVLVAMMTAHSLEIAFHLIRGDGRISGEAWRYDFHTYALQLLGVVLIGQGVRALRAASGLARGDAQARLRGRQATLITLAVAAPLVPIQMFFGILLTTVSLLTLAATFIEGPTYNVGTRP